jgi:hypothetical protein
MRFGCFARPSRDSEVRQLLNASARQFAVTGSGIYDGTMRLPMRHPWPLLALTALLAACGNSAGTATATAPSTASAPATPRIVSTVPAATLNLLLIGGDQCLVGVSSYDHLFLPDSEQNLPVVGDYEQTNYEELVKLRPTVMIIQREESRLAPRLRQFVQDRRIDLLNLKFDHVKPPTARPRRKPPSPRPGANSPTSRRNTGISPAPGFCIS